MKVFRSLEEYQKGNNTVATIGTYDGVHVGHRKILSRLQESAKSVNGETCIISFHPHPRLVLFPKDNPLRLLQTIDEKIATLESYGIDKLMLVPFTREFSRTTSEDFIRRILVETIGIRRIVIGYDHQFGKNREGSLEDLQKGSTQFGYEVEEIPAHQIDNAKVSSTKIRNALLEGNVSHAATYLSYPYQITGKVRKGEQLGRTIGYPTANILPNDPLKLIPSNGVYFVEVIVDGTRHYGMMNVGTKPTVGEFERGIEVNIFDFDQDIYDQDITVVFRQWLRPELKFKSMEEMITAIEGDQKECMKIMATL